MQLQGELDAFAQSSGAPEADAGMRSLKRTGFYVRIAKKPRRALPPRAPGEMPTAVVVEDDANLSRFVSSYLGFGGFHVRLATNRAEVLAEFRKYPIPDLVLLDVMLPDVDGFDILASVRRHPALKNVPVVMLTGKASREAVLKGLAGGADGYITKPFEPDALMSVVRTVMGAPEDPNRGKP
jgi:two-component system OmpR family response regulator